MFNLLIVDDEEESLEWLEMLFEEAAEEINIYTAVSGRKAIEILNCVKCDVVLTDIKMPGMDGMELYHHVKENWTDSRVVFLTGYSTHELLYEAIQDKEIRYLVKTESPERIVRTVLESYQEIQEKRARILEAEKQKILIRKAQYCMQREWMESVLIEEETEFQSQERLEILGIPIKCEEKVLVFVGNVYGRAGQLSHIQKDELLLQTKGNLPGIMESAVFLLENGYLFGILQPKLICSHVDWKRALHACVGALESIQTTGREKFDADIAFAVSREALDFCRIGKVYHILKRWLVHADRKDKSGILLADTGNVPVPEIDMKAGLMNLPLLDIYLGQGNREEFLKVFKEITDGLLGISSMHDVKALELYYNISMIYLKQIRLNEWEERIPFHIGLYPLTRVESFHNWKEAVNYLMQMADICFQMQKESKEEHNHQTVRRVEKYILSHLNEDLGLSVLAEVGGFNASYLSRLFKQKYHCTLSAYITQERMQLAKKLLVETNEKIYLIGEKAGYQTVGSFNRAFQKSEGMTPVEYRMYYTSEKK